jgi:hypothetical protein
MTGLAATDATTPPSARHPTVAAPVGSRLLFAAMFLLALIPVLTTPIPAMSDYLNHLARMYVLAGQGKASPFYQVDWHFYPNLAMDLTVPGLGRWIGVELATRLFLLASQILVVTGSMAIERQVKGRTQIAGIVAILYLFNPPFAWGFLNFEGALGVALWGIAAWLAIRQKAWPISLGVHTLFVAALFAGHMFALGLYGATLGLHELWCHRYERGPLLHLVATGALLAAPAAALLVAMRAMGGSVGGDLNEWWLALKPLWFFLLMNGDSTIVSVVGSLVLFGLVYAMVKRGEIVVLQSGAWLVGGFAVLFFAIPGRLFNTAFADVRVLVGAVLVLPAFLSVEFRDRRMARIAAAVVVGLTVVNVVTVERVWQRYQPIYRAMIASFERLPPGVRLLVAHTGETDDPPFRDLADYAIFHAPTLAVPYAGAFVPTLFTTKGKQPLVVAEDVQRLSFTDGGPVPLALLRAIAAHPGHAGRSFVSDWMRDFDYVCVLGAATGEPLPDALQLIERGDSFALYRVAKPEKS